MLFVVATPIGNLADITQRAIEVLGNVDVIAAEDTRRCRRLLAHLGISRSVVAYHDHNENACAAVLLRRLGDGESVALVSDAGTPLISDPGYRLVREARAAGVPVVAVPGPCAAIAALSVAGLPTDRFVFEGFLPSRRSARRSRLAELAVETRTLVFYESPRRILETLGDVVEVISGARYCVVARELTKVHETLLDGRADAVLARVATDPQQQLGEIVLLLAGAQEPARHDAALADLDALLRILLEHLPLSEAVACAQRISGRARNEVYRAALARQRQGPGA